MAAALLGKCFGLLALVVLLYTCCYGFRIRDGGPQSNSIELAHRPATTCASTVGGRCTTTASTTTTTTTASLPWKRHESVLPRVVSGRKPPVESSPTMASTKVHRVERSEEVEDEDDDDDGVQVEEEKESGEEEDYEQDEDDEDDDDKDDGGNGDDDDGEDKGVVRKEEDGKDIKGDDDGGGDDDDDDDDDVEEDERKLGMMKSRKSTFVTRVISKKDKVSYQPDKLDKMSKYDKGDDEERAKQQEKTVMKKEFSKSIERAMSMKKYERMKTNILEKDGKDEKDEHADDDDDGSDDYKGDDDDGDDDSGDERDEEDEDNDEEERENEDESSNRPMRKLEKVRHADKDGIKSPEISPSKPTPHKVKDDSKKPIPEAKKPEEKPTVHKDKVTAPIEETRKQKDEVKKQKEELKKPKDEVKKPREEPKKLKQEPKKSKEEIKKEAKKELGSSKKVEVMPITKTSPKAEQKSKPPIKPETSKSPTKVKEKEKKPDKDAKKVRPKKQPSTVPAEASKSEKKDSKSRAKKHAEASITLAELNNAILKVPTFVPNFTAVEDSDCQQHGKIFLRQLRGYKLWALQMLDSGARVPSGLLRGNVNQYGDFDQCLGVLAHVKVNEQTIRIQGKYCLATVDLYATRPDMKYPVNLMQARAFVRGNMHDPGHFVPRFTTANWAICLPAACSAKDAESSLEDAFNHYNGTTGIRFSVDVDPNMCYVRQRTKTYSKETVGVLYFYAMIICLVIVATVRDYFVTVEGQGNYSERVIMSFSLRRTVRSLFKREAAGAGDIMCIHGIRSLATVALYIAHQLIPISRLPFSNRAFLTEVANSPISVVLRGSLVYTDSFLLLSGVLTAYNMARELTNRGEIRWFCRFIARFIRLTPALLVVVFWYAFVMEHIGTGPQWNNVIMGNAELCKTNAWTNLLYVQNFFPFEEMCASHTHQLALDMQLSIIAPMLVFFLHVKPIIGIILIFFIIQVSATMRYMAVMNNYLSLVIFHGMSLKQLYKTANLTYMLPLHRATPYTCGIALGVTMHYTGKNVRIHKIIVIFGWLIAICMGSWSLFSPWHLARRDYVYDAEEATQYAVISPISWSLFLCWMIFACFTENGGFINRFLSHYWLLVFSRISYAVYLTQFAVFFYNVGTTRYASEFLPHRAVDLLEIITVLAVSVVLTLLFDLPMQEVKSVIMESTDTTNDSAKQESKDENDIKQDESKEEDKSKVGKAAEDKENTEPVEDNVGDEERMDGPPPSKPKIKRRMFMDHETYDTEEIPTREWLNSLRDESEYMERGRRSRSSQRPYTPDFDEEDTAFQRAQRELEDEIKRSRRSLSRTMDTSSDHERPGNYLKKREPEDDSKQYRRADIRERSVGREPERTPSRGSDSLKFAKVSDESESGMKQLRPPLVRSDVKRSFSSESEDDRSRKAIVDRKHLPDARASDEEDWEKELRLRRKQFMEKLAAQQPGSAADDEAEEDDEVSVTRRSSAEGRIALQRDPSSADNMDAWTVTVVPPLSQLGSSQEPSEPEEDASFLRRRQYRESGPPSREEGQSEEDSSIQTSRDRSYTSDSQKETSLDDEDDVASFNFVLTKGSRRISVQDLSKLSQEDSEELADSGWNLVRKDDAEGSAPRSGLYKRESIIKSQASEEDPEFFVPERPKLVQQEREHPFKTAWQMQKSRSEEDYVVKESTQSQNEDAKTDEDQSLIRVELKPEENEDGGSLADDETDSSTVWQAGGSDTDGTRRSSKSDELDSSTPSRRRSVDGEEDGPNAKSEFEEEEEQSSPIWSNEDAQFVTFKLLRRKSQEANWEWEQEGT